MFIIVIIAVAVIAATALFFIKRTRTPGGGKHGLQSRFGPEYQRAITDHDGDVKAAERELGERVKRHGSLQEQPLSPEEREYYVAQWADVQEQFVTSPQKAVAEADTLLARLAGDRGYPVGEQFEERIAALSVHHAPYVQGYRSMHTAAHGQSGTEEMREAMVEARGLFDALATAPPAHNDRHHTQSAEDHGHPSWTPRRRHAKGSGTS
ncbi:hypothetical protein GCM10009837_20110 [Streptomyces durmitorensis]|uniref:Secreted protein n=1 Tax=Streptomyces durmitorensis TaxID=319947 RepID=A0ABY4PQD3_9ACTN|nr:hypothetical protein [Streptomyces durmitorensis]UQT55332.1 hypothetical protein M4V62_09605 [Streptomyces durmitorensis]